MEEKFYNSILRFLSYRPRSEKEVRDKLKEKKADSKIIENIVNKLKEYNFINDSEFAKRWIESRLKFKPRSLRLIKIELKQKGIDKKLIDDLKLEAESDFESAKKLVAKKIRRLKDLSKQEIYEKLGRFLSSKGFNWDTIKKAIDDVLSKGV